MEALLVEPGSNDIADMKWKKMLIISMLFHVAIFSMIFFVPESISTRRMGSTIYEVNLVEMPAGKRASVRAGAKAKTGKNVSASKKSIKTRRIARPKSKEKVVVLAKRVVKKKSKKAKKQKKSASQLIDKAVAKIERQVKVQKKNSVDHLGKAISRIEAEAGTAGVGVARGVENAGIQSQMYGLMVYEKIKNNWSYPVSITDPKKWKYLIAVVVLTVKNDGTILKSRFEKQSPNAVFNQSVLKAIERTESLPPFPPGYIKRYDEIEITFNLSELLEN